MTEATRQRLVEMRSELVERLTAGEIEPAFLTLLAGVNAGLDALDVVTDEAEAEIADRVVLSDDGASIRLVSYTASGAAVAVVLPPRRVLSLSAELLQAAQRHGR